MANGDYFNVDESVREMATISKRGHLLLAELVEPGSTVVAIIIFLFTSSIRLSFFSCLFLSLQSTVHTFRLILIMLTILPVSMLRW